MRSGYEIILWVLSLGNRTRNREKKSDERSDKNSDKNSNLKLGPYDVTAGFLKELADDIAAPLTLLFSQSLSDGIKFSRLAGRPTLSLFISQVPTTLRLTRGIAQLSILSKVL